jgi:protein-S-isoprenylcysteine O-methyltransferase Ste14
MASSTDSASRSIQASNWPMNFTPGNCSIMSLFVKNLLFTLLVPGTVAVYVPLRVVRGRSIAAGVPLAIGWVVLAAGAALYFWCVLGFAAIGRGTPAPVDAPKTLVIQGPYRGCRNPMYIGVLTVVLGWSIVFRSGPLVLYALAVATVFHLFIVLYEEPHLRRTFGAGYEDYCRRVGRWFPRMRRRPAT